jgi:predicted transcriptional regulator
MSTQVTISLPEETYRRAKRLAQLTRRDVALVMADTLSLSLPQLDAQVAETAVASLSNEELMALADLQMDSADDMKLSQLLDKQQASALTETERIELMRLMQIYQSSLLQKAEGLAEAVRRGLREPLSP